MAATVSAPVQVPVAIAADLPAPAGTVQSLVSDAQAAQEASEHAFDRATKVELMTDMPENLSELLKGGEIPEGTVVFSANIDPAFGNTSKHPNGGYLGSIILSACQTHMKETKHSDVLTINFDYLKPSRPGPAWITCSSLVRGSSTFTDVMTNLYQIKKVEGKPTELIHVVRGTAMFGSHKKIQGLSAMPVHYGEVQKLEDVPAPHPRSWYLPPNITMISQQLDLLVDLETQRRPVADYFVRFHPSDVVAQQHDNSVGSAGEVKEEVVMAKNSKTLPLRSAAARRIDSRSLPMFADFRRPAMENVIKEDAESKYDEPTRKWAYPTLTLSLRFLRPVPAGVEWLHTAWRETAVDGRVISDLKIALEDGTPIAMGSMDTLIYDIRWFSM